MTRSFRIAFLAFAVLPFAPTFAEDVISSPAARRAQIVASSQLGETFLSINRESYRVVVGLRAVSRGEERAESRMAALGMPPADLVEVKGPVLIVKRPAPTGTPAARLRAAGAVGEANGSPASPVAVNTRTGRFGFLTGIVVVELRSPEEAATLARANGLELRYVADGIGYAYFRVPAGRDVVAAAKALRSAPGVESADPEVIETFKVTR